MSPRRCDSSITATRASTAGILMSLQSGSRCVNEPHELPPCCRGIRLAHDRPRTRVQARRDNPNITWQQPERIGAVVWADTLGLVVYRLAASRTSPSSGHGLLAGRRLETFRKDPVQPVRMVGTRSIADPDEQGAGYSGSGGSGRPRERPKGMPPGHHIGSTHEASHHRRNGRRAKSMIIARRPVLLT